MPDRTRIDVPATDKGLIRLVTDLRSYLTACDVPALAQRDVHAAVDELASNIVAYAFPDRHHPSDGPPAITLHVACAGGRIELEMVDSGIAFDPRAHERAGEVADDLQIGGVGIRLARHWVDEMRYERRDSRNHLFLVKRIDPARHVRHLRARD